MCISEKLKNTESAQLCGTRPRVIIPIFKNAFLGRRH